MTNSITPPRELIEQWASEKCYDERDWLYELHIAARAAQWGADQELEACIAFVRRGPWCSEKLRATRRPKPPSLKERLSKAIIDGDEREALKLLEALPNDYTD